MGFSTCHIGHKEFCGGGVYHPILRRLETFTNEPLRMAIKTGMVLDLEENVAGVVKKLRERTCSREPIPALVRGGPN
jgi:hypothetical protein